MLKKLHLMWKSLFLLAILAGCSADPCSTNLPAQIITGAGVLLLIVTTLFGMVIFGFSVTSGKREFDKESKWILKSALLAVGLIILGALLRGNLLVPSECILY